MGGQVLVIHASDPFCSFQGFRSVSEGSEFLGKLNTDPGFWEAHTPVEENSRLKQIVAVAMLVTKNFEKVFSYLRVSKEDPRLTGLRSILVGGHVELQDTEHSFWRPLWAGLVREVQEEVSVKVSSEQVRLLGFINSTEDPFHLGILFLVTVEPKHIVPQPDSKITKGEWAPTESALSGEVEPNPWSKIAHQVLLNLVKARTPS